MCISLNVYTVSDVIRLTSKQRNGRNVCTVVCRVQALQGVAAGSEEGESVSVTAEELQPAEGSDVQLP